MSHARTMRPLTAEQQELVLSCVKLAASLARRWGRRYPWLADEYHGEAMLALVESATSYDPEISMFTTYAYKGICMRLRGRERYEMPMGFRRNRIPRRVPATVCLDGVPFDIRPTVCDPEIGDSSAFEAMIAPLSPREKKIIRHMFVDRIGPKKISAMLGVSEWTVDNDFRRAKTVLRSAILREG